MGVGEFCDGRTPGIPEVGSQFKEKMKGRRWRTLRSVLMLRPAGMFTIWKNSQLTGSQLGS